MKTPIQIVRRVQEKTLKDIGEVSDTKFYAYSGASNVNGHTFVGIVWKNRLGWNAPPLMNTLFSIGSTYEDTLGGKIDDLINKGLKVFEFDSEIERAKWIVEEMTRKLGK